MQLLLRDYTTFIRRANCGRQTYTRSTPTWQICTYTIQRESTLARRMPLNVFCCTITNKICDHYNRILHCTNIEPSLAQPKQNGCKVDYCCACLLIIEPLNHHTEGLPTPMWLFDVCYSKLKVRTHSCKAKG